MTAGLEYLHESNIAHLNLNPSNILCDHKFVWKICDIGLTYTSNPKVPRNLLYAAPEQLKDSAYSIQSDIYTFGLILYRICHPMRAIDDLVTKFNQLRSLGELDELPENEDRIDTFDSGFDTLIRNMIKNTPADRMTIVEVSKAVDDMLKDSYEFLMKYDVESVLGQGTFGITVTITDTKNEISRAIKLLDSEDCYTMRLLTILCRDRYRHPNIITYYASWMIDTSKLDEKWMEIVDNMKWKTRHSETTSMDIGIPEYLIAIELELCEGNYNLIFLLYY